MGNTFNSCKRNPNLRIRQVSPTAIDVTWKVRNFLKTGYSDTSPAFQFFEFDCAISVENREPRCLRLHVSCNCPHASDPQVYCKLLLKKGKSDEGFLRKIPILAREKSRVATDDTTLTFSFLWDLLYYNKDLFAQDELLTLVCKLSIDQQEFEELPEPSATEEACDDCKLSIDQQEFGEVPKPSTTEEACDGDDDLPPEATPDTDIRGGGDGLSSEGTPDTESLTDVQPDIPSEMEIERHGLLRTNIYSPLDMEILWRITDFFHLPTEGSTTISEDFNLPGGKGFIGLNLNTEAELWFMLILFCKIREGIRSSEWDLRLGLVTADGELYNNLTIKDTDGGGPESYFRFFTLPRSEVENKEELLIPRGNLTVCFTLKGRRISEEGASVVIMESSSNLKSDVKSRLSESCYNDLVQDFSRLSFCDLNRSLVIKVEEKVFGIHSWIMTLFMVRMPAFVSEVYKRLEDAETRKVDISDLCSVSAFHVLLDFAVEGYMPDDIPMDAALEVYAVADRFELDNLKELCAKYTKKHQVMIFSD